MVPVNLLNLFLVRGNYDVECLIFSKRGYNFNFKTSFYSMKLHISSSSGALQALCIIKPPKI